jgi:hypothetical protein
VKVRKLVLTSAALVASGCYETDSCKRAATPVTKDNVTQLITEARTPADHEAIAGFYQQEAAEENKTAELHQSLADTYRRLKIAKPVYMAEMCDNMAADFRKTATDANKLAAMHEHGQASRIKIVPRREDTAMLFLVADYLAGVTIGTMTAIAVRGSPTSIKTLS